MWVIVADITYSLICVLVMTVSPAKTAELIHMSCVGTDSCWPKESCIRWICMWAPPGEYEEQKLNITGDVGHYYCYIVLILLFCFDTLWVYHANLPRVVVFDLFSCKCCICSVGYIDCVVVTVVVVAVVVQWSLIKWLPYPAIAMFSICSWLLFHGTKIIRVCLSTSQEIGWEEHLHRSKWAV